METIKPSIFVTPLTWILAKEPEFFQKPLYKSRRMLQTKLIECIRCCFCCQRLPPTLIPCMVLMRAWVDKDGHFQFQIAPLLACSEVCSRSQAKSLAKYIYYEPDGAIDTCYALYWYKPSLFQLEASQFVRSRFVFRPFGGTTSVPLEEKEEKSLVGKFESIRNTPPVLSTSPFILYPFFTDDPIWKLSSVHGRRKPFHSKWPLFQQPLTRPSEELRCRCGITYVHAPIPLIVDYEDGVYIGHGLFHCTGCAFEELKEQLVVPGDEREFPNAIPLTLFVASNFFDKERLCATPSRFLLQAYGGNLTSLEPVRHRLLTPRLIAFPLRVRTSDWKVVVGEYDATRELDEESHLDPRPAPYTFGPIASADQTRKRFWQVLPFAMEIPVQWTSEDYLDMDNTKKETIFACIESDLS